LGGGRGDAAGSVPDALAGGNNSGVPMLRPSESGRPRRRKDTTRRRLAVDCSSVTANGSNSDADTPAARCGPRRSRGPNQNNCNENYKNYNDHTGSSSCHHPMMMLCDDHDDRGASHAVDGSDRLALEGGSAAARQNSSSSAMSSAGAGGLTPSTSSGSYHSANGFKSGGCGHVTDVTSSFLSMSPCSSASAGALHGGSFAGAGWPSGTAAAAATGAGAGTGPGSGTDLASGLSDWSPVSVAATALQPPSPQHQRSPAIGSSWRKRSSNESDSSSADRRTGPFGRIRSNRRKRSLHRQPPSKCLSSLAAGVSILESDGDDDDGHDDDDHDVHVHPSCYHRHGNGDGSDTSDGDGFFPGAAPTHGALDRRSDYQHNGHDHGHHDEAGLSAGHFLYEDRASFNTRPYKRQPSSCEWIASSGYHQHPHPNQVAPASSPSRCSSSNVSGADSPCFSHASSTNGEPPSASVFLPPSAPSGPAGEWGQFVEVVSAEENNNKARPPPQPLAFSPGLGGAGCLRPSRTGGRGGAAASSSSSSHRAGTADISSNLPYFPKSRRRSSGGGRVTHRRRASSVGSHHDMPPGGGGGGQRRRFAIAPRAAGRMGAAAVSRARSASLHVFLEDASSSPDAAGEEGGPSPPPPSPSLRPLSARQGGFPSDPAAMSDQTLTPRPLLDDVSFAMDKMQV